MNLIFSYFTVIIFAYLLVFPVDSFNLVGLLSALLEPKCPKSLLDGECTCKVINFKLHYECDLSFSSNFWGVIEVIQDNEGLIEKLVLKNCKEPLKELDRNFPLIKARILKIKNCGITSIPKRAFSNSVQWIDELDLSNNDLESLDFGIHQLNYLNKLDLKHNKITSVPDYTFKFSDRLTELDLSYNRIAFFSRDAFDKSTTKLKYLDLGHNDLSSLPAHFFAQREADAGNELDKEISSAEAENVEFSGFPELKKIYLDHNNIRTIYQYAIGNLPKLKVLNISYNQVSTIEHKAFGSLPELEELSLDNNNLKLIDGISVHRMEKLQKLHLENNRINRLTPGFFGMNKWLWELNLSNNNITKIPSSAFNGLYVFGLNIANNPISDMQILEWKLNMSELRNKLIQRQMECSQTKNCKRDRLLSLAKKAGI